MSGDVRTSEQVVASTGATYRQVDYWARMGYLGEAAAVGRGTGRYRRWTPEQRQLVEAIVALLAAGLTLPAAAAAAPSVVESNHALLPGGFHLARWGGG